MMKKYLSNKCGEAHINTAVKIIIAVVVGALLLGGLFVVFASENGVMKQTDDKVYDMFNTGGEMTLKHEGEQLLYSYDGDTWKSVKVTGMADTGRVTKYVTIGEGDSIIHLVAIQNPNQSIVCCSTDGNEWVPVKTTSCSINLSVSNTGRTAFLNYDNGMSFSSTNGVDWTMTSTKNY